MAVNFPDNPSNGDTTVVNGVTYTYNSTNNLWKAGSSSSSGGSGGTTTYATAAELPQTATNGDLALVEETDKLYIWNDTAWYNIALINTAPSITQGGAGSYALATDGTPTVITLTATDPESLPVTWSYAVTSGSLTNGGGVTATVTQADNVFTITPTTTTAYAGTFALTFSVTDGANIVNDVNSFTLGFTSPQWSDVSLSIGTSSTDQIDNSTFIDRSTNTHTVTSVGTPAQTAFHPYLDYWSVEFDGSSYFTAGSNTDWTVLHNGLNTWTLEFTCYITDMSATNAIFCTNINSTTGHSGTWVYVNSNGQLGGSFTAGTDGYRLDWSTTSTGLISEGNWHTVSLTFNPTNSQGNYFSAVIDEVAITSFSEQTMVSNNPNAADFNFSTSAPVYPLYIATARGPASGVLGFFNGYLRDYKIDVESQTEIECFKDKQFLDRSTNGYTLNLVSSPKISAFNPLGQESEYVVGANKGSTYFDGASTVDTVGSMFDNPTWTIEFWGYITSFASDNYFVNVFTDNSVVSNIGISSTGFIAQIYRGAPLNAYGTFTYDIESKILNQWCHIAVTHEYGGSADTNSGVNIFVNGVNIGTHPDLGTNDFGGGNDLKIGAYYFSSSNNNNYWNGYISDYTITPSVKYTTNFTPPTSPVGNTNTDLYLPMDNAGIFDKTGNHDLTLVGDTSTSTTQTKFATTSMVFDGTGDYVETPAITSTNNWTIETWFNTTRYYSGSGHFDRIWSHGTSLGDSLVINLSSSNGAPVYRINDSVTLTSSTGINLNTWYHLALVCDGTNTKMYLDGVVVNQISSAVSLPSRVFRIGTLDGTQGYFSGSIEGFQVITNLAKYTTAFTPPTSEQGRAVQKTS